MQRKYIFYLILLTWACWWNNAWAQEKNNLSVQLGFMQVKEEFNQGLVFGGPQLGVGYERYWTVSDFKLLYAPKLSIGVSFSKGMSAICLNITPIDVSFFKQVYATKTKSIQVGINVAANYKYQEYPDIQNAHLFWFGEISLSPCIKYEYHWPKSILKLRLTNSLLGFTSRTQTNDPYFYSFKFSDFLVRPHQNMKFGSFNRYDHTTFHLEFSPDRKLHHLFGCGIEYIGSFTGTRFQYLNYHLTWKKVF